MDNSDPLQVWVFDAPATQYVRLVAANFSILLSPEIGQEPYVPDDSGNDVRARYARAGVCWKRIA